MEGRLRLPELLWSVLEPPPEPGLEDAAAWHAHAGDLMRRLGAVAAACMIVATWAWWPLDAVLLHDPVLRDAFGRLRVHATGVLVVAIAVLVGARPGPDRTLVVGVTAYTALLLAMGEALGWAGDGGVDRGQLGYLADAWLGVVPLALVPMRAPVRLAVAVTVAASLAWGFFGMHPDNLGLTGATAQLSFGVFTVLFSVVLGEAATRLARRAFLERRTAERANAALAALTDSLAAQVAERTRSLRALAWHLARSQEDERRRLAHALHDDLGQQLTAMRYAVARLRARLAAGEAAGALVEDLDAALDGTADAMRGVVTHLRPRVLDDLGLWPALQWLCADVGERTGVDCALDANGDMDALGRLSPDAQLALFRVVQEGTTNALRHGQAAHLGVRVSIGVAGARVDVEDDGSGVSADAPAGFGLLGLRERLRSLGGTLDLASGARAGAVLSAAVPWTAPEVP